MEQATFGAGCFWGVEESFRTVSGVMETAVGFMGGSKKDPTYEQVCRGNTGHVEVVHLTFDPSKISYEKLLELFWSIHDPTQYDRQGPDVGTQYRSVIFVHGEHQRRAAEKSLEAEQHKYDVPIATQIVPASEFYPAEEYHQKFLFKRGGGPSCH